MITRQSAPNDALRNLSALPARHEGLAIINPVAIADMEFDVSTRLTAPLLALIIAHERALGTCQVEQRLVRIETKKMKRRREEEAAKDISERLPENMKRCLILAQEKGASSWLTVKLLRQHGFALHKSVFHDALALRYDWPLFNLQEKCVCGKNFSPDHAMSCPTGGLPSMRHNEIRDILGKLISEVSTSTRIEPPLQPVTGETFVRQSATREDDARPDIYARAFWGGRTEDAFFDVRVVNPNAPSYRCLELSSSYR